MNTPAPDTTTAQPANPQTLAASHLPLDDEKHLLATIRDTAARDPRQAVELIAQHVDWAAPWREGQPHILCFNRLRFELDIQQLRQRGRLNYSLLDNGLFNALLGSITDPDLTPLQRRQSFYPADTSPAVLAHKRKATALAELLLTRLLAQRKIDALLFANMDYFQNWPLEEICPRLGIRTLTLSREHYVSDFLRNRKKAIFRDSAFRYRGDGIALFGACSLPVFTDTGVCPPDKLFVTGAPRMDVWRDAARNPPRKYPHLTLLSFSAGMYNAAGSYPDALAVFARLSRHWWFGRGKKYLVKAKSTIERDNTQKILQAHPGHKIHIKLGDIFDVLRHSRLVVGINSLALLEALLSDAALAVPYWGDARQTPDQMVLSPVDEQARKHITFCKSPDELERLMRRAASGHHRPPTPAQRAERLALFRRYFHYPEDKTCTACVEDFIRACLAR